MYQPKCGMHGCFEAGLKPEGARAADTHAGSALNPKIRSYNTSTFLLTAREKRRMTQDQAPAFTDVQLVANIQHGHSEAETALYERYAPRVYYLALRESRSPHDAEDVRAETFLRVLQAIRGNALRSPEAVASFILGTTRNVLFELYSRRRQAGATKEPEPQDLSTPSHEEQFLDSEVQQAVQQTIVRLKPRDRDLLRMHFYEELPTHEIAKRSGIAPERVRLVKSRALKRFGEYYRRLTRETSAKKRDTRRG